MSTTLPQIFDPSEFQTLRAEALTVDNSINTHHPDFWMTSSDRAPVYQTFPTLPHWEEFLRLRYNSSLAWRFGVDLSAYIQAMSAYHNATISPQEAINGGGGYGPQFEPSARVTAWTNLDAWKAENTYQHSPSEIAILGFLANNWMTRNTMAQAGVTLTQQEYGYVKTIPRFLVSTVEGNAPGQPVSYFQIRVVEISPREVFIPFKVGTASAVDMERSVAYGASPEQVAARPSPTPRACDTIGIQMLGLNADPSVVFPPGTPNLRYNPDGSLQMPQAWLVTRGVDLVGGLADHMFVVIAYEVGGDVVAAYSFAPDEQTRGTLVRHPWSMVTDTTEDDIAAWNSLESNSEINGAAISQVASAIRIDAGANYVAALGNHASGYLGSLPGTGPVAYEFAPHVIIGSGANSNSAALGIAQGSLILNWLDVPGRTLTNQRLPPRQPFFGAPGYGQWRIAINVPEEC